MKITLYLTVAGCLVLPAAAAAQDTRAEEIAARQQAKAKVLKPYQPTGFEKLMGGLEETFASPPNGFYPAFGSIYPGGGLRMGVGWRRFYARKAVFDVHGLYSVKNYKLVEVGTRTPWNAAGRFEYRRQGWLARRHAGRLLGVGHGRRRAEGERSSLERIRSVHRSRATERVDAGER